MSRNHRALLGAAAAGLLLLPLVGTSSAAPPKKAPPKKAPARAKPDPKAGKEAFGKEGCTGCHKTKDFPNGGTSGPDLSAVGKDHTLDKLVAKIMKPGANSIMPATKDRKTAENLAAYLLTQK